MNLGDRLPEIVFVLTLLATYGASILARMQAGQADENLAGRNLNKWLVGLSAATTGNSGFIVTAAVGLGYSGGVKAFLMPLGWLIGDLVFWRFFPGLINRYGRKEQVDTLPQILTLSSTSFWSRAIVIFACVLLVICLSGYVASQWLAGEKFMSGAFRWSGQASLILFGLSIVGYSVIGGFRGSIYVDVVQAFIRVLGTVVALGLALFLAYRDSNAFWQNISGAGSSFLSIFPNGILSGILFSFGFSFVALGFGLGQPQIISRYMAGRDENETQGAKWIYISFVQFTWIAMTAFGVLLRGITPDLSDGEQGLSLFFRDNVGGVLAGIVFADIFATIAATSNGIIIAISQLIQFDLIRKSFCWRTHEWFGAAIASVVGAFTVLIAIWLPSTVFDLAVDSVSLIGATLAGPIAVRILHWPNTERSIFAAIMVGIASAFLWKIGPFGETFNGAGIGMVAAVLTNFIVYQFADEEGRSSR